MLLPIHPADRKSDWHLDLTFGQRNVNDRAKVNLVSYATPAVEVNKHGDIVLVYMRSGANVYPEARYSLYAANAQDISPSKLLRAGASTLGGDLNTCIKKQGQLFPDREPRCRRYLMIKAFITSFEYRARFGQ